jgi:FKBP-type peptidyl-prolyl cis-trans isomerase
MAQKRQRVAAGAAALFFLIASLATSVAVIYTLVSQSKNKKTADPTTAASQTKEDPLVGTKLANFEPGAPVTALQITDTKVGDGAEAKATSTVSVLYTGALAKDGVIFESSGQTPVSFPVNQVIKGWQDGVPGMKVGGTRRLIIPASDAYGANANAKIPANSDLVFDITLLSVQ